MLPSQVGEVACGGQGGEKLIQEQHGCRQNSAMPMPDMAERLWNVMAEGWQ